MKVWRRIWLKSLFCFAERPSHALNFWQDVSLLTENKFYQLTKLFCRIIVQIEKVWKRQTLSGICYSLSTNQVVCFRSTDFLSRTGLGVGFTPVERTTCHWILCQAVFPVFWKSCAAQAAAQQEAVRCPRRAVVRNCPFLKQLSTSAACTRACSESFHASHARGNLDRK